MKANNAYIPDILTFKIRKFFVIAILVKGINNFRYFWYVSARYNVQCI